MRRRFEGWPAPAKRPIGEKSAAAPAWFGQQVELAKWLVALSSGLLAFAFGAVKEKPEPANLMLFFGPATLYFVCISAALLFIFNSNTFERLRERGVGAQEKPAAAAQRIRAVSFPVMLLGFGLGSLLFLAFMAVYLRSLTEHEAPPPAVTAVQAPGGPTLIAQRGERLWMLARSGPAADRWRPLPPVPPPTQDRPK